MRLRAILTFISVFILFGCQKDTQTLDLKYKALSSEDEVEGRALSLEQIYEDPLSEGTAVMSNDNVISFLNPRLSQETLRELEVEVQIREQLLNSEDFYLCVTNFLPGYEEAPEEVLTGGGTELPRTLVPVTILSDNDEAWEIEHTDSAGNRHIYWHIGYDYMANPYWGKRGIIYADGRERYFIARYRDCPSIQDDLFNEHVEIYEEEAEQSEATQVANSGGITLPGTSSGFSEYVCTEDDPLRAYATKSDARENENPVFLPRGFQLTRVQGGPGCMGEDAENSEACSSPITVERNGLRYIRVQTQNDTENDETDEIEGRRFWVAEDFVEQFEDCAPIQTHVSYICSETSELYFSDDQSILNRRASGSFTALSSVYRRYGEYYSKKIVLDAEGEEVVYVPVSENQVSNNIVWIKESSIPENCPLNPEVPTTFRSSEGHNCVVFANDNFPLDHAAREDYVRDHVARFGAARDGGRRSHPATDLYSYYRHGNGSTNRYGGQVRAINRSVVKRKGTWRHTVYLVVKSNVAQRSWIYGEIGDVQVNDEQALARNQLIGKTAQYVRNNSSYPAMLHLELFDDAHLNGGSHYGAGGRYEGERVDDPTCEVEYMSRRKFNKIWEGQ